MNKVIVVSKTHLDLGFTDFAKKIKQKYLSDFIPSAVQMAAELNVGGEKKFVWTTGSWLIKEALEHSTEENKAKLITALKRGDIAPHGCAFTTHTELMDGDLMEYSLSLVDKIDAISGRKTVAAKMTDVPGHTIGLVPFLYKKGIKLLHIGINGASAIPKTPECFLWKKDGAEVIVISSADYGGYYKCDLTGDVLYFDHTYDNHGTKSTEKILQKLKEIQSKFEGYTVVAGRLDDFAESLWEVREKLPVLTSEVGDSWIHGVATDPYKTGAFKELCELKNEWLKEESIVKNSSEYNNFCDSLICVAEHTWGLDMKKFFADYENYLKKDFEAARANDIVKMRHPFREFPINYLTKQSRRFGGYETGSYKTIEAGWAEQRAYIDNAVETLGAEHKLEAQAALARLRPTEKMSGVNPFDYKETLSNELASLKLNSLGGIEKFVANGKEYFVANDKPVLEYVAYGTEDYKFWLKNYTRNYASTWSWAVGDFGRPLLKYADKKFPKGRFAYKPTEFSLIEGGTEKSVLVTFETEGRLSDLLGAPRIMQIMYTLSGRGVKLHVIWLGKDASRITESLHLRLFPKFDKNNINFMKIGSMVNPYDVVEYGNRNLSATEGVKINNLSIKNKNCPLTALGKGKILRFDNLFEQPTEGVSFVLLDNVWGTNFPLWYEDNAAFDISLEIL